MFRFSHESLVHKTKSCLLCVCGRECVHIHKLAWLLRIDTRWPFPSWPMEEFSWQDPFLFMVSVCVCVSLSPSFPTAHWPICILGRADEAPGPLPCSPLARPLGRASVGLHWADRASPSWQHFKDHLTGPQRGNVFGFQCWSLRAWMLRSISFHFFVWDGLVLRP